MGLKFNRGWRFKFVGGDDAETVVAHKRILTNIQLYAKAFGESIKVFGR